jgi:UDP-N-acetylglucosamine 2-epimerase (non-hydrolysing)
MGTRPEVVKLAPVLRELRRRPERFTSTVCATGQHRQLLDRALEDFDVTPDVDLDLMREDQELAGLTARALLGLDQTLARERPDVVLVQGDTTTALAGALAAYYRRVAIGHVEAGLRTGDNYAPFPEEGNRRLIAPLADLHFAPTEGAARALTESGIDPAKVVTTGNTVVDALLWMRDRVADRTPPEVADLAAELGDRAMLLVTAHRREHFGPDLESICLAIQDIADQEPDCEIVYPVHLNPHVRAPVGRLLDGHPRIHLLEPLGYGAFVWLMQRATAILTDSGGVQEEAPSLGTPVLVTRDRTERPEGVAAGCSVLVGVDRDLIASTATRFLRDRSTRAGHRAVQNPYGDGQAAVRIADALEAVR